MSTFLLAPRDFSCWRQEYWLKHQYSFSNRSSTQILELGPLKAMISRVDDMGLWGPATDPETGNVALLCGRTAASPGEWRRAEEVPYSGGLACRLILDRWRQSPERIEDWLNGAFVVVVWEPGRQALHVITDRMGMFPVYRLEGDRLCLGTHTDLLADAAKDSGFAVDLDETTVAEMIATGSATHPHTYYRQIKQLDPATRYEWRLTSTPGRQSRRYWQPAYIEEMPRDGPDRDYQALGEELAHAFSQAVARRTQPHLGKVGVMLSGGLDSRIMLGGMENPQAAEAITFCDGENDEVRTARKIAAAAGARHHVWQRDEEYYVRCIPETVRISGGIWSATDGHYTGFHDRLDDLDLGVLLTGCYADYMFKGLALNRRHRTLLGRNLPLYELSDFDFPFYQPHFALRETLNTQVMARLSVRYAALTPEDYTRNPLAFEAKRLQPLSREPDSSGRLFLWRTQPFDWIFGDNDVLEVYGRIPVGGKINGRVYELAVKRVCGPDMANIYNNNYKTKVGASERRKVLQFIKASAVRKMKAALAMDRSGASIMTTGSWPDFHYVLNNSALIQEILAGEQRPRIDALLAMVHPERRKTVWQDNPTLAFRLLTLSEWMRQRAIDV